MGIARALMVKPNILFTEGVGIDYQFAIGVIVTPDDEN